MTETTTVTGVWTLLGMSSCVSGLSLSDVLEPKSRRSVSLSLWGCLPGHTDSDPELLFCLLQIGVNHS